MGLGFCLLHIGRQTNIQEKNRTMPSPSSLTTPSSFSGQEQQRRDRQTQRRQQGRKRSRLSSETRSSRKIRHIVSEADRVELEKHYRFVVPSEETERRRRRRRQEEKESWQDRMVQYYHSHLYKEYVLADLTTRPGQIGLRWRTKREVEQGRGHLSCGNKHCPNSSNHRATTTSTTTTGEPNVSALFHPSVQTYNRTRFPRTDQEEKALLSLLVLEKERQKKGGLHRLGLKEYMVPFRYHEHGTTKQELVKLRLCCQCAPLLLQLRAEVSPIDPDSSNDNNNNNNDARPKSRQNIIGKMNRDELATQPSSALLAKEDEQPQQEQLQYNNKQRHKKSKRRQHRRHD